MQLKLILPLLNSSKWSILITWLILIRRFQCVSNAKASQLQARTRSFQNFKFSTLFYKQFFWEITQGGYYKNNCRYHQSSSLPDCLSSIEFFLFKLFFINYLQRFWAWRRWQFSAQTCLPAGRCSCGEQNFRLPLNYLRSEKSAYCKCPVTASGSPIPVHADDVLSSKSALLDLAAVLMSKINSVNFSGSIFTCPNEILSSWAPITSLNFVVCWHNLLLFFEGINFSSTTKQMNFCLWMSKR